MARDVMSTSIKLDRIVCHDEGDGWGSAEPYLWTVFFKIDGETVAVTEALTLAGTATIVPTPGSHGNLPNGDVDPGEVIPIPPVLGEFTSLLNPIPVPPPLQPLAGEDLAGIIGVVIVLMEEDNVSDDGAEAGHQGLNNGVAAAIADIIATRSFTNPDITEEEIAAYLDAIEDAVVDAITDNQNIFEDIWAFLNADDQIGSKVFFFDQDDLTENPTIEFSQRFENQGDWEIFGQISASVVCPADALAATSGKLRGILPDISTEMRAFRDKAFPGTQLHRWWTLAERNAPVLAAAVERNADLQASTAALAREIPAMLKDPGARFTNEQLGYAAAVFKGLAATGNRRARIDASRALDLLPHLQGRTVGEGIELLSRVAPARNPVAVKSVDHLLNEKVSTPESLRGGRVEQEGDAASKSRRTHSRRRRR